MFKQFVYAGLLATIAGCDIQSTPASSKPTSPPVPVLNAYEKNTYVPIQSFDTFGRYENPNDVTYECKGVTTGDLDGDGDVDVIIITNRGYFLIENKLPQKTLDAKLTPEQEDKK